MRRFLATITIAAIGLITVSAGIALAADLEIVPAEPEVGEAELTIEVSDFDPDTPIYAVPCDISADGTAIDIATSDCDVAEVEATMTDSDGRATIVVNWDIPVEGITVYVGDEARDNQVSKTITPSVHDGDADDPDVAVLGTNVVQEDELAETGPREAVLVGAIGAALVGLGMAFRTVGREAGRVPIA